MKPGFLSYGSEIQPIVARRKQLSGLWNKKAKERDSLIVFANDATATHKLPVTMVAQHNLNLQHASKEENS